MLQLERLESYNYVEIEVKFLPEIFPFYPPSVKLVRPRIENFVFGRIVTMPELQLKKWNPTCNTEHILTSIKTLIEKYGNVNPKNPVNKLGANLPPFTEVEFQLLRLSMLTDTPSRFTSLEGEKSDVAAIGISNLKSKNPGAKVDDTDDIGGSSSDKKRPRKMRFPILGMAVIIKGVKPGLLEQGMDIKVTKRHGTWLHGRKKKEKRV
eukprot:UN22544